jgi:aminopeptidase N
MTQSFQHGVLIVGLATLALQLACGGDRRTAPPVDEGVSWALAELRAQTLSDLRYSYRLRVPRDLETSVEGTLVAEFRWSDPRANDLVLDFTDPVERVRTVRVNGLAVAWRGRHDHVIVPASALASGERNRVDVDFEAGNEALNRNPNFLYTLFVPDRAHFALPLFDQPNLKARFSLTLEVPDGWVAVANGGVIEEAPVDVVSGAEGGTIYRFAETEPIPTYLFAFAVGDFQVEVAERAGRTLRMFHREIDADKVARNREAIFDLHAVALAWLEDYTDIAYPFSKFDFVLIPPFQYGGMEHPGSVFYRQSGLLLDESATQAQYLGRASLIAHETTHMWFGDLVTMAWFDDVWTKEVFANFMAAKIVHPSFPEVNHDLRFFLAHHDTAYAVDRTAGANPIRQPLENLKEAGSLYGPIIYQKAPIVMRQLERLVGEDLFRDGLREYLQTFRYGNASWLDLIDILDRRTEVDLAAWSEVWVDEPGRPVVTARIVEDDTNHIDRLLVSQEDPHDQGRLWPQQLEVLLAFDARTDAGGDVRVPVLLSGASADVGYGEVRTAPSFVLPNATGVEYGHFRLDSRSVDYLMSNLPDHEDPLTRGIALVTLWDSVLEGEIALPAWLDLLLSGLRRETVEQNTQRMLGYLGTTYWVLLDEGSRRALAPRVEAALWSGLIDSATVTQKAAFFEAWRGMVLSDAGLDRMQRIWDKQEQVPGVVLSESDFTALAEGLVVRGVDGGGDILDRQAERIENPDRLARFTFVRPALSADPAVRETFFESLRDPANREREPWVLAAVGYLHHPVRAAHARRFIRPSLDLVEEIQRTGDIFFPSRWLDATLRGHNSAQAAETVRAFLEGLSSDYPRRLREKVQQSADMLFRSAGISEQ